MKTLKVNLAERSYNIFISSDNLQQINAYIKSVFKGTKIFTVTNSTIYALYEAELKEILQGFDSEIVFVPDGEQAKSLDELGKLYTSAISAGLDRHSAVIAFGGGVVGDVTGFLAATLFRGIAFIQIPTTLLAQVDSSVGGKVAVNHALGKNLIGAFYQPKAVIIDTKFLRTLPERELKCGLAEVLKYAMIWDESFLTYLENNVQNILNLNEEALEHIIEVSCSIKAEIVSKDETEESLRAILNFGHTVGHALENIIGYGVIKHGEAVAVGMAQALKIALKLEILSAAEYERMSNLLNLYNLPTEIPEDISLPKLIQAALTDKKAENTKLTFILTPGIGKAIIKKGFTAEDILELL